VGVADASIASYSRLTLGGLPVMMTEPWVHPHRSGTRRVWLQNQPLNEM
jgi:hypothetical protein